MSNAKRKWTLVDGTLVLTIGEASENYDLTRLFPDFMELDNVQRQVIVYGIKQKLADTLAGKSAKDGFSIGEQFVAVETLYQRLCDGHFTLPTEGRVSKEQGITALMEAKDLTRDQASEIWDILHKG